MSALLFIVFYFMMKAVFGSFWNTSIFSGKGAWCVILGSILGGFISIPLFSISNIAGYIGIGVGICIMWILLFTNILGMIPQTIRNIFSKILKVLKYFVIIIAIILVVVGACYMLGL